MMKHLISYFWKLPLCGIAFFVGMASGGVLLPMLGFTPPAMPEGTDANTIAMYFLLGSMLLAIPLSLLSRRLQVGFLARWLILFMLVWGAAAVGMVIEAYFFMDTGAVSSATSSLFTMLNFVLPALSLSLVVGGLFPSEKPQQKFSSLLVNFFSQRKPAQWAWRLAAAVLAFPLIYITFGLLVNPLIIDYYQQGLYELAIPTWGQLIPLQIARGFLFLLICLPILVAWRSGSKAFTLLLGFSLTLLVGFMSVITSYWLPWQLRLFHGLEILADSFVYALALTLLLYPGETKKNSVQETASEEPGVFPRRSDTEKVYY